MTTRVALRREDALRARMTSWKQRVARSAEMLAEALMATRQPYVALSGGKDSLVTLWLVAMQRPGVTAIWVDDELEDARTPDAVRAIAAHCGAELRIKTGTQRHAEWFRSWHERPYWREPEPDCLVTTESIRVLAPRWGYDAVVLGVRASESPGRRIGARRWGPIHMPPRGMATVKPILWWELADVWAAIAEWDLPYHPAYDDLARAGVPRERQRIGPLCYEDGWVLRTVWPELHRRLIARYGDWWGG